MSRACIEKVGGFSPIFFHYGEDLDYYNRTIYHGFKVGICLDSKVIHDKKIKAKNFNPNFLNYQYSDYARIMNPNQRFWIYTYFKKITSHFLDLIGALFSLNLTKARFHLYFLKETLNNFLFFKRFRKISSQKNGAFL